MEIFRKNSIRKDINSVIEVFEIPLDGTQGVGEFVGGPLELFAQVKDSELAPQGRGLGYAPGAAVVASEGLSQRALQIGVSSVQSPDVRQCPAYFSGKIINLIK